MFFHFIRSSDSMKESTPVKHKLICMWFWFASEAALPSLHNPESAIAEHNFTHPLWRLSLCNLKHLLAGFLTLSVHQRIPRAFSDTCYLHTLKFFWAERQRSQYPWPFHASLSLPPLCRCRSPLPVPKRPAAVTISLPRDGYSQLC